jgi:Fur family transcriptional regulator, ferric uptake regulator
MSPYDESSARQRNTRQRYAVAGLLADVDDFRTAQELHGLLRDRGERVGLTTVYRTLQTMADAGELDVMRLPSGEQLFRQCSRGHHHHLVCRACGRTVEVAGPTVESWADRIANEHGFVDISHTVEVIGTCSDCVKSQRSQ